MALASYSMRAWSPGEEKAGFCHVPWWTALERLQRGAEFVCAATGTVYRQSNPSCREV
jgi:hypothetical protein